MANVTSAKAAFPDDIPVGVPQHLSPELIEAARVGVLRAVDACANAKNYFGWAEALFMAIEHFADEDSVITTRLANIGGFLSGTAEDWFATNAKTLDEANSTFNRLRKEVHHV